MVLTRQVRCRSSDMPCWASNFPHQPFQSFKKLLGRETKYMALGLDFDGENKSQNASSGVDGRPYAGLVLPGRRAVGTRGARSTLWLLADVSSPSLAGIRISLRAPVFLRSLGLLSKYFGWRIRSKTAARNVASESRRLAHSRSMASQGMCSFFGPSIVSWMVKRPF